MPTSLDGLRRHRTANADGDPSRRVWLFHSHAYFRHDVPERVEEARAFMAKVTREFASTPHVEVHGFTPRPVGPHPLGNFEVLFTREVFADYVTWLAFHRPEGISVLVHPLTDSQLADHTSRAMWLGPAPAILPDILARSDAANAAAGRSEESIIEGTKKH